MLKPIALCINNSLIPERKLAPGNPQPPNPSQRDFCQAAALIIWLACSSRKLSPLYLLRAGSGGTSIKPRGTLLILVVVRLHHFLLVAQPCEGWLVSLLAVLALGLESLGSCGSSECLVGSVGDRWESVRSRKIWIIG